MTRTTLLALAERVEAATGADRELDCLIWAEQNGEQITWQGNCMVAGVHGVIGWIDPGVTQRNFSTNRASTGPASIPAYTASLDAAMSLVPWDAYWRLGHDGDGADPAEYKADVIVPKLGGVDARGRAIAVTPPLALTAASLRAIAGSLPD